MSFRNYKDSALKLCKRIRVSFAQDTLKCQNKNPERLVFKQEKSIVVQWVSRIIIQKPIILFKLNIEVSVYNLRELKHRNANSM